MSTKLYVENLAAVTTESDLMNLFSAYGNVAEMNVPVDRANGKRRSFGFVTMVTPEGARAAIQALNGKQVDARTINVSEAPPNARGRRV
jgi:RNA recognition motif-containing protein